MEIEGKIFEVFVLKRPFVEEFLRYLAPHFEIVIYTASLSKYADPLLDALDPHGYSVHRLFREHCTFHGASFVKDLSKLGRNLKDVIIVDVKLYIHIYVQTYIYIYIHIYIYIIELPHIICISPRERHSLEHLAR